MSTLVRDLGRRLRYGDVIQDPSDLATLMVIGESHYQNWDTYAVWIKLTPYSGAIEFGDVDEVNLYGADSTWECLTDD